MKITFLGTSHGYEEPGRFCSSAVITTNGKHYMIDAGAPVLGLLRTYGFEYTDLNHIFITHSHPDHYLGLVPVSSRIERFGEFKDVRFTVHTPIGFPAEQMLTFLFGAEGSKVKLLHDEEGRSVTSTNRVSYVEYPDEESLIFEDENIKITAIPNDHCSHSHSFLVECEGKKAFFSGDFAKDFPDMPAFLTDENTKRMNLMILEGAHTRFNKPEIMEIISKIRTQRLIVTHVNYGRNTPAIIDEMRNYVSDIFPVDEAFDGMIINI